MKLSKALIKILDQQEESAKHLAGIIIRLKHHCTALPSWFTDKSADYYEGMLQGCYASTEAILHGTGNYKGFGSLNIDARVYDTKGCGQTLTTEYHRYFFNS